MIIYAIKVLENSFRSCFAGETRIVGYYSTYEQAKEALIVNSEVVSEFYDVKSSFYDHAIIEKIPEGIYATGFDPDNEVHFFEFNETELKYEEIEKPANCKGIVGFIMG